MEDVEFRQKLQQFPPNPELQNLKAPPPMRFSAEKH